MDQRLWLFARTRETAPVAAGLGFVMVGTWWGSQVLAALPYNEPPAALLPAVALAPVAAAAVTGQSLGSPDVLLDRATPVLWPVLRMAVVLGWTVLGAGLLVAATLPANGLLVGTALVRNVVGYVGLTCLGAVVLGAETAWVPVLGYALPIYLMAPTQPTAGSPWWAWPMQAGDSVASGVVALTLFLVGATVYALQGARS